MAINKFKSHVLVIPEDDANRQIAVGFVLDPAIDARRVYIEPVAGGWPNARDRFHDELLNSLRTNEKRFVVLLIDYDGLNSVRQAVPEDIQERTFVIGALNEPEDLRPSLGSYENIGKLLAKSCREGETVAWEHELLRHNLEEVRRMYTSLRPILFPKHDGSS